MSMYVNGEYCGSGLPSDVLADGTPVSFEGGWFNPGVRIIDPNEGARKRKRAEAAAAEFHAVGQLVDELLAERPVFSTEPFIETTEAATEAARQVEAIGRVEYYTAERDEHLRKQIGSDRPVDRFEPGDARVVGYLLELS